MDRLAIIAVTLVAFIILHLRNLKSKTQEERCEGMIAIYTFTCCFSKLYIPLYTFNAEQHFGSFGSSIMIWTFFLFCIYLLWHIKVKQNGFISPPNKIVVFTFLAYTLYTLLNPNNSVVGSSMIAIFFFGALLIFYYLLANAFSCKTLVRGIYQGLAVTIAFEAFLCVLFPILNMEFITKVFVADAQLRGESSGRFETVGTFAHPNAFGVYASYVYMFFLGCVITNFKRKQSLFFLALSLFSASMSGSRSALAASLVGTMALIIFYVFRRYSLINPKVLLRGVIPVLIIGIILVLGPLNRLFEDAENLDSMAVYRMMHYYCAGEIIQDHPLVGVGINAHLNYLLTNTSIVDFEAIFDTTDMWEPEEFMLHNPVHNIWLILLSELGIIGFLPILTFVIYYIASFKRRIRIAKNKYFHIIACTGLGIMCTLLVQGNSDWNPLTQQQLIISLMFFTLSLNKRFMAENYYNDANNMNILPQQTNDNETATTITT